MPNSGYATWKVNGVVRTGETNISFKESDFQNGVITLETTASVTTASLSIGGGTTAPYPYNVKIEPTINGKLATDSVLTFSVTDTFQRDLTY